MNQSQPALTEEESNWIAGFAGRLRLIQADASTAPAEKRREYLQEEIMRRLKELPETNRSRYLAALLDRFPVAGRIYEPVSQPLPEQPAPAPVPETPEQILHRFLDAIQGLPDKERRGFAKLLINSGVIPDSPPAASPTLELSPELRRALGLPAECQPRLDRLAQLAVQLIEVCSTLDQTALKTLNQIDPRSPLLRRPQDIRGSAARFLAGESESAEAQVRAVTALLGGLLAAMLAAGKDFGREYLSRFSPAAIEDVVAGEPTRFMGPGKKERCWEKYTDLANDFATPDLVDRRIKDCLAAFIKKTLPR